MKTEASGSLCATADSVPVSAAPPTGAPPVSPGLLHTTAPAIRRGDRQARCAKYLLAAKEGLARARSVIDDIRARLDLPENSANVPEVPVREPVTHGDSPTPDATPADGPTAVHNLPGQTLLYLALLVTGLQEQCHHRRSCAQCLTQAAHASAQQ